MHDFDDFDIWRRWSRQDGDQITVNRSDPTDSAKASYAALAGKKGAPQPGVYDVTVAVERDGLVPFERKGSYE